MSPSDVVDRAARADAEFEEQSVEGHAFRGERQNVERVVADHRIAHVGRDVVDGLVERPLQHGVMRVEPLRVVVAAVVRTHRSRGDRADHAVEEPAEAIGGQLFRKGSRACHGRRCYGTVDVGTLDVMSMTPLQGNRIVR